MHTNRRCGIRATLLLVVLATLSLSPSFSHGQALTLVQSGARYAGTGAAGFNGDSGLASSLNLNSPSYIVFDAAGNQYLSDTLNNCVRKIDTAGNISTIAGLAVSGQPDTCNTASNPTPAAAEGLYRPTGLAIDSANRLYIADSMHHCVRMLANGSTGVAALTTVAGTCGSDNTASATPSPSGIAIDSSNNLYIALQDSTIPVNQVVRHTDGAAALNVCYLAGAASANVGLPCPGIANGIALSSPSGLAIDAAGNLFIADTGNNCIREVAGLTTQKTAVGQCANDGSGASTTALHNPYGLTLSLTQSLLITQSDNVVSYTPDTHSLAVVAGLPSGIAGPYNPAQDGSAATNAALNAPRGIATDSMGNVALVDSQNNITRKLTSNVIFPTTAVGSLSAAMPITFTINQNVALSAIAGPDFNIVGNTCTGNLNPAANNSCQVSVQFAPTHPGIRNSFIKLTDSLSNTTITQGLQATGTGALTVSTPGIVNTIASRLSTPNAITVDTAGNAYFLETGATPATAVVKVIPATGGSFQTVIPQDDGLFMPSAIAADAAGNWFIADAILGTVARFGIDGAIDTSYITGLDHPTALAADAFGNLYIAQAGAAHSVIEFFAAGTTRIIAASFVSPSALTLDLNGNLYVADSAAHLVYAIDNGVKSGAIRTVAGNGTTTDTQPGQATGTALLSPVSLAVDAAGDVYIADSAAKRVYVVYASTTSSGNNIASILGTGEAGISGDNGPSNLARINNPVGVAVDGNANVFVVDSSSNNIRKITYPTPSVNFGGVAIGNTSSVLLTNLSNVGTSDLSLNSPVSLSDPHFAIDSNSTTCGAAIKAGSICTVGFTFTPTAAGALSATATVSSTPGGLQSIQLTGSGNSLAQLQYNLVPETAVYGQSFPETLSISLSRAAPTGTITFTTGSQTLCTFTGTLSATTTCNAAVSGLAAGNYPVTFTYSGDSNYASASGSTTLTIVPAPLKVSVNNATRLYGAPNPAFPGTVTGAAPGETILVSYSTDATVTSPVGGYQITATLTPVGSASLTNYSIDNTPGLLIITPAPLTIAVANSTRLYGSANPAFANTVNGTLNGDSFIISDATTATANTPIGSYPVTAMVSGLSTTNYTITVVPGTISITPAPLSVVVNNATRTFGSANPVFTSTITGALNGEMFTNTYTTTATTASPAGTYPINDTVTGNTISNYTLSVQPGTLTITQSSPAPQQASPSTLQPPSSSSPGLASQPSRSPSPRSGTSPVR